MSNMFYVWVKEFERNEHGIVDGKITFCDQFTTTIDAMNCYVQILEDGENEGWKIWEAPRKIEILEDGVLYTPWAYAGPQGCSGIQEATYRVGISTMNPCEE